MKDDKQADTRWSAIAPSAACNRDPVPLLAKVLIRRRNQTKRILGKEDPVFKSSLLPQCHGQREVIITNLCNRGVVGWTLRKTDIYRLTGDDFLWIDTFASRVLRWSDNLLGQRGRRSSVLRLFLLSARAFDG